MAGIPLPAWHKEEEVLYPGTVACLRELSSRYHIGIIANQSPGTVRRLKAYGLMPYIELVIASAEECLFKPDPEIFRLHWQEAIAVRKTQLWSATVSTTISFQRNCWV